MSQLYAFGNNPLYYYSQSSVSMTNTGSTWSNTVSPPFATHASCVTAAVNTVANPDSFLAVANTGQFAYSNNLSGSWYRYYIDNGYVSIKRLINAGGNYIAVGHRKNPTTLEEHAVIYVSNSGATSGSWYKAYEQTDIYSGLMDVVNIPNTNTLIAGGYTNGLSNPFYLISLDLGTTWQVQGNTSFLPSAIYSLLYAGNKLWFGHAGSVTLLDFQQGKLVYNRNWRFQDQLKPIVRMAANSVTTPTNIVALQSGQIHWTSTFYDWQMMNWPGYVFTAVTFFNQQWLVGISSMLSQYTGAQLILPSTLDSSAQLVGFNNQTQTHEFVVV